MREASVKECMKFFHYFAWKFVAVWLLVHIDCVGTVLHFLCCLLLRLQICHYPTTWWPLQLGCCLLSSWTPTWALPCAPWRMWLQNKVLVAILYSVYRWVKTIAFIDFGNSNVSLLMTAWVSNYSWKLLPSCAWVSFLCPPNFLLICCTSRQVSFL